MKLRSLVVAAMFLAGCASQQSLGSSDTYNRDSYECTREASLLTLAPSGRSSITA
jgi:hypothetical protein